MSPPLIFDSMDSYQGAEELVVTMSDKEKTEKRIMTDTKEINAKKVEQRGKGHTYKSRLQSCRESLDDA